MAPSAQAAAAPPGADGSENMNFDKDDAAWLVRQFGRFRPLLQTQDGCPGFLTELGLGASSAAPEAPVPQDADRSRRLLQWANRQHKERLQHLKQLGAAHSRFVRSG